MSNIQWTDVTDNPVVAAEGGWWCKKISPGCANCYAEKLNNNAFFKGNHLPYNGKLPELELKRDILAKWSKMTSYKKHFVGSMTDIFGEWVPLEWQIEILDTMLASPKQTFQLLTKRPSVMEIVIEQWLRINKLDILPGNIWVGTSVENQAMADLRIPQLVQIPAKVRFLSVEPLLEKVDLKIATFDKRLMRGLHWVIVGGESGVNARPCRGEWLISIVKQCKKEKVAVFVKQLGSNLYGGCEEYLPGINTINLRDKKGGDMNEFPDELKIREFPCS